MAVWSGLGITVNIPHIFWYNYEASIGEPIIKELVSLKITKIRVTFVTYGSDTSRTAMRLYCSQIREALPNAYVIFGTTCSPGATKISASNWDAYASQVVEDAEYAEANGLCDEFVIGNEMENDYNNDGTLSAQEIRDNMKLLATAVSAVYSGVVSYNVAQGQEDGWVTDGKGTLDKLGFNIYGTNGTFGTFKDYVVEIHDAFGDDCYISEWSGSHPTWSSTSLNGITETSIGFDDAYAVENKNRLDFIRATGLLSAYFFTHTWYEPTARNGFAMRMFEGGYRKTMDVLLERRVTHKFWGN